MSGRHTHSFPANGAVVVATVPPRIPVLHAEDLPGADDWAVLTSLGVEDDAALERELQDDRYGTLMLAPAAFD